MIRFYVLTFFLLFLLFLRFVFLAEPKNYPLGQRVTLVGNLSSEPQLSTKSQRFMLDNIEVVVGRYPEYHYGDKLMVEGVIKVKQTNLSGQTNNLLAFKKQDLIITFPKVEIIERGGNDFLNLVINLRQKLVKNYQDFLPEPSAALLTGIVLGVKTQMSPDFKENLRRAGLTHVVVASGMNITLVAGFLSGVLTVFLKRRKGLILVFAGIFFYAFLAGFEAPIVRAAIMGSLALLAQGLGRQSWSVLSLIYAGLVMLFIKPVLLWDLGFQLSFLATAGLILIKPILDKTLGVRTLRKIPFFGESLTTTLAAQLATLPLILAVFGYYNPLSLLANILVLWTIPWIMGIGGGVAILGLALKPLGQTGAWLTYPFLFYFEKITLAFSQFSLLSFKVQSLPLFFFLAYFAFLTAFLSWLKQKETKMALEEGEN